MALADDVAKLAKNQATLQKNFLQLKSRLDALEARSGGRDDDATEEPASAAVVPSSAASKRSAKETASDSENMGFKVFGFIGFSLILLGLFYLYSYAVAQRWIDYGGRIALGVVFSLLIIGAGEIFRRRQYPRFAQLLAGGGTGLLYFTTFATYAFSEYRAALGMTQALNTVLLLIVVACGVGLAIFYDAPLLASLAFGLGFLSAAIAENVHQTMIYTFLLAAGMSYLALREKWRFELFPVIASYFVFFIFAVSHDVYSSSSPDALFAFIYLVLLFSLFNALSVLMAGEKGLGTQAVAATVINAFGFLVFGLSITYAHAYAWRGAFLLITAGVYFMMMAIAREREQRTMFEAFFITAVSFLTVAVPVQLERAWIGVAWAVEGALLVRAGLRVETRGIRVIGYIALFFAACYTLLWMSFQSASDRSFSYLAAILALYTTAYFLSRQEDDGAIAAMRTIMGIAGSFLLVLFLAIELGDRGGLFGSVPDDARMVLISVAWAVLAIALIIVGFIARSSSLRVQGVILFGVVVLKILFVDLGGLETIYRVIVTMLVGGIALGGAFVFIKNKDKIHAFLEKK